MLFVAFPLLFLIVSSLKVKVAHSCPTLCNPTDHTVHGILLARIPEWVAIPFSRGSFQPRDWTQVSQTAGLPASHQGSPRILEWVAYPFSRGSSWPRNQTGVSCIAGEFFTSWATREAHLISKLLIHIYLLHVDVQDIQVFQHHLLKRPFFSPFNYLGTLAENQLTVNVKVYFWTFSWFQYFVWLYPHFDSWNFVLCCKTGNCEFSNFVPFQDCLGSVWEC